MLRQSSQNMNCSTCGELFATKEAKERHQKRQHENVLQCMICNKPFATTGSLKTHLQSAHSSIKRYTCSFPGCSVSCTYPSFLKRHETTHTDHKVYYKCKHPGCIRKFSYKPCLTRHQKTHEREERGEVLVCSFENCTFTSVEEKAMKEHLDYHLRPLDHHKCPCGFVCKADSTWIRHRQNCTFSA